MKKGETKAETPKTKKRAARSAAEGIETSRGEGATSPLPTPEDGVEARKSVAERMAAHVLQSYPEAGRCYVTDDGTCFLEGERGSARRYAESTGQGLWVYEGGALKKAE